MHILISNDDGYRAPGIDALAKAMQRFGTVTVVAPEHNHSGASNSLSLTRPLTVEHQKDKNLYVISGTPSDCVHVALTGLLPRPDLLVTGINCGANMGEDTLYSGTVAAAIEGYLFGVDAIAFSQIEKGWAHLDDAARIAEEVVERFLKEKEAKKAAGVPHEPMLLSVNIPNKPYDELKGIRATRLGRRHYAENVIREMSPRGFPIYWLGAAGQPDDASEGTDFWATANDYVSITPLQIDLTAHHRVEGLKAWAETQKG